ncbi:MAG: phosphotransferase [Sneathiella sp.]|nr:phosphotransferase [Sneathiella sp.]
MSKVPVTEFLASVGWQAATRNRLAGDASSRRYERLDQKDQTAILMIDPSIPTVEKFLVVTDLLKKRGYSPPDILAQDPENGLLLLEDFGQRLFVDLIGVEVTEEDLYSLAVDFLIDLRKQSIPIGLPVFSQSYVLDQNSMFLDWFIPEKTGQQSQTDARLFYQRIWKELLGFLENEQEVMLLRDFHAENILQLEGRLGVKALGLLDYQDAMTGPAAYDMVSLLQDARRDVPAALEAKMITRYVSQAGLDEKAFRRGYHILGAHRALRIMGIFTRLAKRDGKTKYLAFMPRMEAYLRRNLAFPDLIALKHWVGITLGHSYI